MKVINVLFAVAAGIAVCGATAAQRGRFDVLPTPPALSACGVGLVAGLRPGGHLLVRSESRLEGAITGQLNRREYVWVCNEDRDEQDRPWYGVVYSRPDHGCSPRIPRQSLSFNSSCQTGWVRRQWIELLTG